MAEIFRGFFLLFFPLVDDYSGILLQFLKKGVGTLSILF